MQGARVGLGGGPGSRSLRRGWLLLVAGALLAAGCGYRFAVGGADLPEGIERVYVPVFENRSVDAEAGALFAGALADALGRMGRAGGPGEPSRVEGVVLAIDASPAATGPDGTEVGLYRLRARLLLRLVHEERTLCVRELAAGEDYLPNVDLLGTETTRRQAVRRLATRMMESAAAGLCPVIQQD